MVVDSAFKNLFIVLFVPFAHRKYSFTPFNRPKSIKEDLTCVLKPSVDREGLRVLGRTVFIFSLFNFKQH